MGEWVIVVHGTGAHHNKDYPADADRMAQKFVDDLVVAGHQIALATFTSGGRTVLDTIDNFAAARLATSRNNEAAEAYIASDTAKRITGLQVLGLAPSKRKDPLPSELP